MANTTATDTIIRYYVSPTSAIRGWYVKRVLKTTDGQEIGDNWLERFDTKREAKAAKDAYNNVLVKNGTYEAIS